MARTLTQLNTKLAGGSLKAVISRNALLAILASFGWAVIATKYAEPTYSSTAVLASIILFSGMTALLAWDAPPCQADCRMASSSACVAAT